MDTNHIIITGADLKDKASNQQKLRNQLPAPFHFNGTLQPVKALLSGCIGLPRIKKKMATYANQVLRSFWTFYLGPTFFSCSLF
jgi:hypothetical protein